VEGEPEGYLEQEKYAALRELIEITNADTHTFDVVYTEDMGAIMRFSEGDMAIIEGRALTREDSANGTEVCVISRELAGAYGLGVGDEIKLKLGEELFEQFKGLGAVAVTRERYSRAEKEVTLEIAGIYMDTDAAYRQKEKPHWNYSINTVFVPKALLPVEEGGLTGHEYSPAELSIVIDDAWEIAAFLEEAGPQIEGMGLRLLFNDNGWLAIEGEYRMASRMTKINIVVFGAAVIIAASITVYLYIARKKGEYAIMRALGTPRGKSAGALAMPLMAVSAASIAAGVLAAWQYTGSAVGQSNALRALEGAGGYAAEAAIPAGAALACILCELLLVLAVALAMLRRLGTKPPLALLQRGR
jgi:hypothetical protein